MQAAGIEPETGERVAVTDPRSGEEEYAALAQDSSTTAAQTGLAPDEMPDTGGISTSAAAVAVLAGGLAAALVAIVGLLRLRRSRNR